MKFPETRDVRFMCRGQENDSSPDSPMHTYRCIGRYEKVFRPIKWVYGWRASPVSKARKCIGATEILRSSFWLSRTGSVPAKSRQQHIWRDPLAAVVNGITPTNSTTSGPNLTYTLIGGTSSSLRHHHQNQLLIVATIKPKQFTLAIRNELAVSVVMENSQLVVIQLDLTPIGS